MVASISRTHIELNKDLWSNSWCLLDFRENRVKFCQNLYPPSSSPTSRMKRIQGKKYLSFHRNNYFPVVHFLVSTSHRAVIFFLIERGSEKEPYHQKSPISFILHVRMYVSLYLQDNKVSSGDFTGSQCKGRHLAQQTLVHSLQV